MLPPLSTLLALIHLARMDEANIQPATSNSRFRISATETESLQSRQEKNNKKTKKTYRQKPVRARQENRRQTARLESVRHDKTRRNMKDREREPKGREKTRKKNETVFPPQHSTEKWSRQRRRDSDSRPCRREPTLSDTERAKSVSGVQRLRRD